ncbi:MAG: hypothetical protein ACLVAT_12555 [Lachnospiraceae bacterium]
MSRYGALREDERKLLKNGESLLEAADVIESLDNGIIPKKVFENLMATKEAFTYTGTLSGGSTYTLTWDGKNVKKAGDVKAGIKIGTGSNTISGTQAQVEFAQSGKHERYGHTVCKDRCEGRKLEPVLAEPGQADDPECKDGNRFFRKTQNECDNRRTLLAGKNCSEGGGGHLHRRSGDQSGYDRIFEKRKEQSYRRYLYCIDPEQGQGIFRNPEKNSAGVKSSSKRAVKTAVSLTPQRQRPKERSLPKN